MNATDNNTLEVLLGNAGYGARDGLGRWVADGLATPEQARLVGEENAAKLATFVPGARVRTTRELDRYPHFIVEAGSVGTVVDVGDPTLFAVKLDDEVPGADDWGNEVHWSNGDSPHDDLELVDEQPADPHAAYRESVRRTFRAMSPAALAYQSTVVVGGIDREELEAEAARRLGLAIDLEADRRVVLGEAVDRIADAADPHLERTLDGRSAAFSRTDDDAEPAESFVSDERDEQDAAYERVSFPKVELDPDDAAFIAENLDNFARIDEGENTDYERLLEVARMLEDRRAIARAGALGVELAFAVSGEPVFDAAFVNLMLDEIEALPVDERPAAVRAVNDGSDVRDRRAYEGRA